MSFHFTMRDLTERVFGDEAPLLEGAEFEVRGKDGAFPFYVALYPDDLGDDPQDHLEAVEEWLPYFGESVGALPGFSDFYDGQIEEAGLFAGEGAYRISGTCVSTGGKVAWVDVIVGAGPEGILLIVAFSHLPARRGDPTLDPEALGLGPFEHVRDVSYTIGAG